VKAQWFEPLDTDHTKAHRERTMAQRLDDTITELYASPREQARRSQMLFDLELYFGRAFASLFETGTMAATELVFSEEELKFNHCFSICSTVRNRICSFRPRSEWVPESGDYLADRGAEDMSAMNEAWSIDVGRQATMALWFRDVLTCDGGVWKVLRDGAKIDLGRFPPWEFLIDEVQGLYGKTPQIHHVQFLPIDTVAARYDIPVADLMMDAATIGAGLPYYSETQVVRVADTYVAARTDWVDGKGKDEKGKDKEGEWVTTPGHHAVLVGSSILADYEEWEFEDFPIGIGCFEEGMVGTWGTSAVRMLRGIQLDQNEWCGRMSDVHYMTSLQVWQTPSDEDGPTKINNSNVRQERFKARPSQVTNPPAMGPEAYQWSKLLREEGYNTIGVSQFIAAGIKQPQTSSGVAIDATSELQTDRLALLSQLWETQNNLVDKWWYRLTRQAAQEGVKFRWKAVNEGAWKELTFGDPEKEWLCKPQPTSVFGQTVGARLTKATEMLKAGAIDPEEWRLAVGIPDLKPITDLRDAARFNMQRRVDRILQDNDLRMPGPYVDPQKMYDYAVARWNLADADDTKYPAENMASLAKLIDAMQSEIKKRQAPAPLPPALPGLPGAAPGIAAPSPLVPPPPVGAPLGAPPPPAAIGGPIPVQ